jgi:hypothetical protein
LWEAIATLDIAVILVVMAVALMVKTHSILIGEGATDRSSGRPSERRCITAPRQDPSRSAHNGFPCRQGR